MANPIIQNYFNDNSIPLEMRQSAYNSLKEGKIDEVGFASYLAKKNPAYEPQANVDSGASVEERQGFLGKAFGLAADIGKGTASAFSEGVGRIQEGFAMKRGASDRAEMAQRVEEMQRKKLEAGQIDQAKFDQLKTATSALQERSQDESMQAGAKILRGGTEIATAPIAGVVSGTVAPIVTNLVQDMDPEKQQKLAGAIQSIEELGADHPVARDLLMAIGNVAVGGKGTQLAGKAAQSGVRATVEAAPKIARLADDAANAAKGSAKGFLDKRVVTNLAKQKEKTDNLIMSVAQSGGDKKVVEPLKRVLSELNTEGVRSYEGLSALATERIKSLSENLNQFLEKRGGKYMLDDLATTKQVGQTKVSQNFVSEALSHLDELYTKTDDLEAAAKIKEVIGKAKTEGLSLREINDIAKEYGSEFRKKAFSAKTGNPLTSVNATKFENVRKGVKQTMRFNEASDIPKLVDAKISDLKTLQRLADQAAKKVAEAQAKVEARGIMGKIGNFAGKAAKTALNLSTLGTGSQFLAALLPSNIGLKTLNYIEIEKALSKNLLKINKMLDMPDDELARALSKELPRIKSTAKQAPSIPLLPEGRSGIPKAQVNQPINLGPQILDEGMAKAIGTQKSSPSKSIGKGASSLINETDINFDFNMEKPKKLMDAEYQIVEEMITSQKGERIFSESGVSGLKSTFPKWVPEELRTKKLFQAVIDDLVNGKQMKGSKKKLFMEMKKEALKRLRKSGAEVSGAVKDWSFADPIPF